MHRTALAPWHVDFEPSQTDGARVPGKPHRWRVGTVVVQRTPGRAWLGKLLQAMNQRRLVVILCAAVIGGVIVPLALWASLDGVPPNADMYEVAVLFNTSVRSDDLLEAQAALLELDPRLMFRLQESFPPTARAILTTSDPAVCSSIELSLEAKPYVQRVICEKATRRELAGDPEKPVTGAE